MDLNDKALEGFLMMINNNWNEAENIFMTHKDQSNLMCAGASLVHAVEYFLTNSKHNHWSSLECSGEALRRCRSDNKKLSRSNKPADVAEFISNEITSMQAQICQSIINIVSSNDIITSCWNIKQSWKQHKKVYREMIGYLQHVRGRRDQSGSVKDSKPHPPVLNNQSQEAVNQSRVGIKFNKPQKENTISQSEKGALSNDKPKPMKNIFDGFSPEFQMMISNVTSKFEVDVSSLPAKKRNKVLELFGLNRIMICGRDCSEVILDSSHLSILIGQLSLGFGLFLLAVHLLPQSTSLQVMAHLFGFHDNQGLDGAQGLVEKLMLSSLSQSCLSPFACCILTHFLLVSRPLMIMNSNNLTSVSELPKIELLLQRMRDFNLGNSMFYLFFKGKYHLIKREYDEAVRHFEAGVKNVKGDFKFVCRYELSRCKMVKFDWFNAAKKLEEIRKKMPFVIVYHIYITAVTFGASGNSQECKRLMMMIHKYAKDKQKDLSEFFGKRVSLWFSSGGSLPTKSISCLLCYELLYLWNVIHACSLDQLKTMLAFCLEIQNTKSVMSDNNVAVKVNNNNINNNSNVNNNKVNNNGNMFAPLCLLLQGVVTMEMQKRSPTREDGKKEVKELFVKCLNHSQSKSEEHVLAFAAYELGIIKLEQGDVKAGQEYFLQAKRLDSKHIFFRSKTTSGELERFLSQANSTSNHDMTSFKDDPTQISDEVIQPQRSISSRFKGFFTQRGERVEPPNDHAPRAGFQEDHVTSLVASHRKLLMRIDGDDNDVGEGDDNDAVITKGCVVQ